MEDERVLESSRRGSTPMWGGRKQDGAGLCSVLLQLSTAKGIPGQLRA